MFPVMISTVVILILIGFVVLCALVARFRPQWRLFTVLLALALFAGLSWYNPPKGQFSEMVYLFNAVTFLVALIFGYMLAFVMRIAPIQSGLSVMVLILAASTIAGLELRQQYVPKACTETPLKVNIAGQVIHLPHELRPRLEFGDEIMMFGRLDQKYDYANLCRRSGNGANVIAMDTVWITPASNHKEMTAVCNSKARPKWCKQYAPDVYQHMIKISIDPVSKAGWASYRWREGGSQTTNQHGHRGAGSVCALSDPEVVTGCTLWEPFGEAAQLSVKLRNTAMGLHRVSPKEAREMMRQARNIALAIIIP